MKVEYHPSTIADLNRAVDFYEQQIVKDNVVRFSMYRHGIAYYTVRVPSEGIDYLFPVPVSDIGDATLLATDKAMMFMRYIRKAIEEGTFVRATPVTDKAQSGSVEATAFRLAVLVSPHDMDQAVIPLAHAPQQLGSKEQSTTNAGCSHHAYRMGQGSIIGHPYSPGTVDPKPSAWERQFKDAHVHV